MVSELNGSCLRRLTVWIKTRYTYRRRITASWSLQVLKQILPVRHCWHMKRLWNRFRRKFRFLQPCVYIS